MTLGAIKPGKYAPIIFAIGISLILITVTSISVRFIYANDRNNVSHHITTRLQATSGLIELWERDYLMGVHAIAEDPGLIRLVDKLTTKSISLEDASKTMDEWLRPIYLGRGYEGHTIIAPDYTIILASSPAFNGKPVSSPISRETIGKAMSIGKALGRPTEAAYPVRMLDHMADAGTLFQLGCARISDHNKLLAVLCLRQDPLRNFFAMLGTGFSGVSGETYAVDRNGEIISPTRFGLSIIRTSTASAGSPIYVKGLQARVPGKTKMGNLINNPHNPLTKAVALAMQQGQSGFIDGYLDYRGVEVVGAVKWLPEMDIGIVVEQDVSEVYAPFRFSCNAIIGLSVIAIILINTLVFVLLRGRKSLAEREQSMRAFLDNFPGLAHMRDTKGHFVIANKQMEAFIHMPHNHIIGHTDDILQLPQRFVSQLNSDHQEVIKTGRVLETIKDITDLNYKGVEWIKTIRFPVIDSDTNAICAVGTILMDISEQTRTARELEAIRINLEHMVFQRTTQLENAKLEAEQAARAKSDFLANMSHEIRTPMNAIIGLSQLATLVSDDPKLRGYLQRIHQSSTHLLSIINDILDYSKVEAGKMTVENTDFSLEDMLTNVISLLWDKAEDKGLELLLKIDADIPDNLKGDALRLGQILINFTSNAVKFTETGEVILRVHKLEENAQRVRVRFEVEDTGIGIPPERFEQLFKPFHQLDTSSTRRFEGTGLGLTISKSLVELMDGKLDIHSEPGVGSCFSVELNLSRGAGQAPHPEPAIALQGRQVLVVDDNQHARDILNYMLGSLGLDVTASESGAQALDLINARQQLNKPFDIVFLDWKMPGLSGIETAEKIHQLPQQPKLVLVSAHSKQEIGSNAEDWFSAMLCKPITPSALYETIISLLKNKTIKRNQTQVFDLSPYKQLAGCQVLLVDDNDTNQDVVKELLNLVGAQIVTAINGQEALECVEQTHFDMVLMDIQMPVMDGMEATRRLRSQSRFDTLPIIAMTANALDGDRERCLGVGMNDYISKPIYPEILFRTMLRWYSRNIAPISTQQTVPNPAPSTALSKLHCISGLEVDQAMERLLGNQSLYIKLVARFALERSDIVDVIESALNAKNLTDAIRQAHSFKSLAGTIGANDLQTLALHIELALQQNESVKELLPALREQLNQLITAVRTSLDI